MYVDDKSNVLFLVPFVILVLLQRVNKVVPLPFRNVAVSLVASVVPDERVFWNTTELIVMVETVALGVETV